MGQLLTPSTLAIGMSRLPDRSIGVLCREDCIPSVYIGDADVAASADLIRATGWQAKMFDSLEALADGPRTPIPSCLVFDISRHSPGELALHERLRALRPEMPIICTTKNVDLAVVVSIMKAGAFDVLGKPIVGNLLLDTIHRALQRSEVALKEEFETRRIRDRYESLSNRERQVMSLIVSGLLNKQVGGELGISEITVKAHRGRLMLKMQARSFASLVKMAAALNL
jgi:FixJ family two-component response regulator